MDQSTAQDGPNKRWIIGVGRADVTDLRSGLGMAGFAYPRQRTSGELLLDPDGDPIPLYARAFYLRDAAADARDAAEGSSPRGHVLIVVVDIWTCTMAIKAAVLDRLNAAHPAPGSGGSFTDANVLIAGTHTHSAPGGYSDYALYNYSIGGWNQGTFEAIVAGIVEAALVAIGSAVPGRVLLNRGDLYGCGGNRAVAALRRNPEFRAEAPKQTWTDTDMVVLRFVADSSPDRDVGMLTWFALHPTSLGMFNRVTSGDNKGWAAMLVERQMRPVAPGFVAAFGNANAGDVSGNVSVDDSGELAVRRPFGGERQTTVAALPRAAPKGDFEADLAVMRRLGAQQAEFALRLFHGAERELSAVVDSRAVFVDMAAAQVGKVDVDGAGGRESTAAAAYGISFGAGSTEDGIAFASIGPVDVAIGIPEGMDSRRTRFGRLGLITAGATAATCAALALARRRPGLAALMAILPVIAAGAAPACRGAAAASIAQRTLASELPRPTESGVVAGSWEVPPERDWSSDFVQSQAPKPVMFAAGLTRWRRSDSAAGPEQLCPLAPNVIPVQVLTLGELGIVAVPAEFTSTAGRRLKRTLHEALAAQVTDTALAGYANGYSGYVTTAEEYSAQLYEGASTLYGPHTLAAYQQIVRDLATALVACADAPTEPPYVERFAVPMVAASPD